MVPINVTGFIIQCKTGERFWRGQNHGNKPYISSVDVIKYVIPTPVILKENPSYGAQMGIDIEKYLERANAAAE